MPRRDCAPPPHARRSTSSLRLRGSGPPDPPASGPARILSKNLNGIKSPGKLGRFLRAIKIEHRRNPLAAVLAQEHNLRPASRRALESAARAQRILVAAAFLPDDASSGARGGTLVAIPYDAIELAEGESIHDAVERVEASIKTSRDGRIVSVSALFSGRKLRLVSAYAPSAPSALRPPFFRRALPRFLSKSAVLGIDANCVPDPTIDLRRDATSPYDNKGAAELADVVNDFELIDVAREQLGAEPFFSAHHTTPGGGMCHSRIDQIYAPSKDALLWSHHAPASRSFLALARRPLPRARSQCVSASPRRAARPGRTDRPVGPSRARRARLSRSRRPLPRAQSQDVSASPRRAAPRPHRPPRRALTRTALVSRARTARCRTHGRRP